MKTELLYARDETAGQAIHRAAEILKSGGLVAMPTETVYGLAASAFSPNAVKKIFEAKGRPGDNPLIVHIAAPEELDTVARAVSEQALRCMRAFWPGPFTAVVPKSDRIPACVSGGLDTVAVRMPDHPVARAVIQAAGVPLAAPSANRSGSPSPTTAQHVIDDMQGRIDAILVSGDCAVGVESTVVSFACSPPRLLRPGGVTAEQLRELVPDLVIDPAVTERLAEGAKAASPGMKYKHYAPRAEVVLAVGSTQAFTDYCKQNADRYQLALCFDEDLPSLTIPALSLGPKADYAKQAERLFARLRELDDRGVERVVVHAPDKKGVGLAVYNRLVRAAGFQVITL